MPKKVKIILTVVDPRTPGMCGEAVLKVLEDAGYNVSWLVAQAYSDGMVGHPVTVKKGGK